MQLSQAKEDIAAAERQLEEISADVESGAQHDIDIDKAVEVLQSVTAVECADDVKHLLDAQREMRAVLQRALKDGQDKLTAMRLLVRVE